MGIAKITAAQFAAQLVSAIQARNKTYDTAIGPIPDLIVGPVSRVAEGQNDRLKQTEDLLSLANSGSFTRADLEAFVLNEGIRPDLGAPSQTTLTFSTAQVSSNLTVISGYPVGTLADETTGQAYTFIVTQDTTLPVATKSAYFNATTQRYELPVLAQCTSSGPNGNVGANRINQPLRPLVGFDSVFNHDAAAGGRPATSDAELIEQYLIAITGAGEATPDGTRRVARDLFTAASDTLLAYGSDPLLTRAATDAGAVDLWILGNQPIVRTDITTFLGVGQPIALLQQPVSSVTSVVSGATTYVQGADFDLVPDATGYSGSVRGADAIVFKVSGAAPAAGASLTVTYVQNGLISSIQTLMNAPEHLVEGRDLLVRAAIQVDVAISAQLKVRTGFAPADVQTLTITTVTNFVSSLMLAGRIVGVSDGGAMQQSDVNEAVRRISGVDNFVFTLFSKVGGTGVADIALAKNQYPRLASANLIITLV